VRNYLPLNRTERGCFGPVYLQAARQPGGTERVRALNGAAFGRAHLDRPVRLFNNLNMSSDAADLKSSAAIRIAATELFAERGYADVTVRQIAAAAGVSPALVIHHYGSKEGLRAVIDERVAALVEVMLSDMEQAPAEGSSASVVELFANWLEHEPATAGYVRRLLSDGAEAGTALFQRLYDATQAGLQALERSGAVRPTQDPAVRSAFLLSNDLALVLLRPHIAQVTGIDPLSRDGLLRWSEAVFDVYACGLFAPARSRSEADQSGRTASGRAGRTEGGSSR
jgi:AcrR family transcriptional regulator